MSNFRLFRALVFIFTLITSIGWAVEFPASSTPFRYVNDYSQTLNTQQKQYLEQKLQQYSKETSSQIAVVILPTLGGYPISEYAFELGDKWGIGRKQLNNGVLMLIAKNDRKIFIAVGAGLEGVLPDATLSQIIRQQITPYFKQGQYAQGIDNGLNHIIALSMGEYKALDESENWQSFIPFLMISLFVLAIIFGEISWHKNSRYVSPVASELLHQASRSRHRNFGGGFGGGSNNGFGGGGFGGGGAGGSW